MKPLLVAALGAAASLGAAGLLGAARLRTWGTRGDEATGKLAGQGLVPGAGAQLTHAVDIGAPAAHVWPWVAQLGQDKGGFYSYAWLENLSGAGIVNAETIEPAWQHPQAGDLLRLHPAVGLEILRVDPGELLVAGRAVHAGLGFQWTFLVRPRGESGSRLLVRERYVVPLAPARLVAHLLTLGSALMSRRMLLGIRDRAERARFCPAAPSS